MTNTHNSNEMTLDDIFDPEMARDAVESVENPQELITGYQVHRLVNKMLETAGLATIRPQMVYNYMKQRLIPQDVASGRVTRENAVKWAEKYVAAKKVRENS